MLSPIQKNDPVILGPEINTVRLKLSCADRDGQTLLFTRLLESKKLISKNKKISSYPIKTHQEIGIHSFRLRNIINNE